MTLVNVPNAVDFLLTAIEANGFVPEQIVVEFTESEAISRFEDFTSAVRQLKSAGISVTIDHFGAGFAGLQLLAQFQPDRIKINRDMIIDVHKSGPRQGIIQAIIKCCTSLEIQFCAVGVEKAEEWMWLESAGDFPVSGKPVCQPAPGGHSGDSLGRKNCSDFDEAVHKPCGLAVRIVEFIQQCINEWMDFYLIHLPHSNVLVIQKRCTI